MEKQLALLEPERDWKLDQHTREVGLRGVAQARAALRAAAAREADDDNQKGTPARHRSAA